MAKMATMHVRSVRLRVARFWPATDRRRRKKRYNNTRLIAPLSRKISGPIECSTTGRMKIVKQNNERKKKLIWKVRRA